MDISKSWDGFKIDFFLIIVALIDKYTIQNPTKLHQK